MTTTNRPPTIPANLLAKIQQDARNKAEEMADWTMDLAMDFICQNDPECDPESERTQDMVLTLEAAFLDIWITEFKREV